MVAVTLDATTLATVIGSDAATATRLLPVVTELVQDYAPLAPEALQNEACLRCAGWLYGHPSDGLNTNTIGDFTARFSGGSMLSPLKYSGAEALLSKYKVRRAGSA